MHKKTNIVYNPTVDKSLDFSSALVQVSNRKSLQKLNITANKCLSIIVNKVERNHSQKQVIAKKANSLFYFGTYKSYVTFSKHEQKISKKSIINPIEPPIFKNNTTHNQIRHKIIAPYKLKQHNANNDSYKLNDPLLKNIYRKTGEQMRGLFANEMRKLQQQYPKISFGEQHSLYNVQKLQLFQIFLKKINYFHEVQGDMILRNNQALQLFQY